MNPFISLIVPVYNGEKYLRKCLESLVTQTYSNFEIIIINDGSTDTSKYICEEFKILYKMVRVIHIENSGVSNARNLGIEKSRGQYIAFVDSDDFVDNMYLENMLKELELSNADMVICGINQVQYHNSTPKVINKLICEKVGVYRKEELDKVIKDLITSSYINYCYSKLIKKSLIIGNNITFDKNLDLGEDTLFILECLKHSKSIQILDKSSYFYIMNSSTNSLTYKKRKDKFETLNFISKSLHNFCFEGGYLNKDLKQVLNERYFKIIQFCLDENLSLEKSHNFLDRIKSVGLILKKTEVKRFIEDNQDSLKIFPKVIIDSIKTRNSLIYISAYYFLIISRKVKNSL